MPAKPKWFQRLPQILEELMALDVPVVDRSTLEKLFGLSRRGAINLMGRFDGYQIGKTFVLDREQLIGSLGKVLESDDYTFEQRRKERLTELLKQARKHKIAAGISIAVEPAVYSRKLGDLPEGVKLERGELSIRFESAEELLGKLFELAQAISNDFEQFRKAVEQQ